MLGALASPRVTSQEPSLAAVSWSPPAVVGMPLGVALLAVAGEDVAVGRGEPHATRAAQPHGFQLGGLGPAAVAGGAERLL